MFGLVLGMSFFAAGCQSATAVPQSDKNILRTGALHSFRHAERLSVILSSHTAFALPVV